MGRQVARATQRIPRGADYGHNIIGQSSPILCVSIGDCMSLSSPLAVAAGWRTQLQLALGVHYHTLAYQDM